MSDLLLEESPSVVRAAAVGPVINGHAISAPALHAARTILAQYEVRGARFKATENNLAIFIDVCTRVDMSGPAMRGVLDLAPAILEAIGSEPLREKARKAFFDLEYALNYQPSYGSE